MPLVLNGASTKSNELGEFVFEFAAQLRPTDILEIHSDAVSTPGRQFPFMPKPLSMFFGDELYPEHNNVIARPIYIPILDMTNAVELDATIDPERQLTITTKALEGAALTFRRGSVVDGNGMPYRGPIGITEVSIDRTPALLPDGFYPEMVITVQPMNARFTESAKLTLPNRLGLNAGVEFELMAVDPDKGEFNAVARMRVSPNRQFLETIEGGIVNGSWIVPILVFDDQHPQDETKQPDCQCSNLQAFNSEVDLYSGALVQRISLPTYNSLGISRGVELVYDSGRANSTALLRFSNQIDTKYVSGKFGTDQGQARFFAQASFSNGEVASTVSSVQSNAVSSSGLVSRKHFWSATTDETLGGGIAADLAAFATGLVGYRLEVGAGLFRSGAGGFTGRSDTFDGVVANVNSANSEFGRGWGIAGVQRIVANSSQLKGKWKDAILLIDGDGTESVFLARSSDGTGVTYLSPVGDSSILEKIVENDILHYRRTMSDQTVFDFDEQHRLQFVTDRLGNRTEFKYDDNLLTQIVDPVGLVTTFAYDSQRIASVTDPSGRITTLTVDEDGRLHTVETPDHAVTGFRYDTHGLMYSELSPLGYTSRVTYSPAGQVVSGERKNGTIQSFEAASSRSMVPDSSIGASTFTATPLSNVAILTNANGNIQSFALNNDSRRVSERDSVGIKYSVARNAQQQVTELSNGRGQKTSYVYDGEGRLFSTADTILGNGYNAFGLNNRLDFSRSSGLLEGVRAIGDVNGDGLSDAVIARRSVEPFPGTETWIELWLGDGHGTFSFFAQSYEEPGSFNLFKDVVLADLDGDGISEIVTSVYGNATTPPISQVMAYQANGPANAGLIGVPLVSFESGLLAFKLGDVNSDGYVDILATSAESTVQVYHGDGSTRFVPGNPIQSGVAQVLDILDVDNDGLQDVVLQVVLQRGTRIETWTEQANGTFVLSESLGSTLQTFASPAIGDINGDHFADIVFQSNIFAPELRDLNGDGILDLIGWADEFLNDINILIGAGDGSWVRGIALPATGGSSDYHSLSNLVSDVNNDGFIDIVLPGSPPQRSRSNSDGPTDSWLPGDSPRILLGSGDSRFGTKSSVDVSDTHWIGTNVVHDISGDGIADILFQSSNDRDAVRYLPGATGGALNAEVLPILDVNLLDNPKVVGFGDLDGDSDPELILRNLRSQELLVFKRTPTGDFAIQGTVQTFGYQTPVTLQDIDGDLDLDIVDTFTFAYVNDGDGNFIASPNLLSNNNPPERIYEEVFQDVDGDGRTDLLLVTDRRNDDSSGLREKVELRRGLENGVFDESVVLYPPPSNSRHVESVNSLSVRDVTKDGLLDIIFLAAVSGHPHLIVLKGNADGGFEAFQTTKLRDRDWFLTFADIDGDALDDAVTAKSILFGKPLGGFGEDRFDYGTGNFDPIGGYVISSGPAVGDFDGDSSPDIVFGGVAYWNATQLLISSVSYEPSFGQVTRSVDQLGRLTEYDIDSTNGAIREITRIGGIRTRFRYTDNGQMEALTDALGRTTEWTYNEFGQTIRITFAKGTEDEASRYFDYDEFGNQTVVVDENGNRTEFEYDVMNRLRITRESDPDGNGPLSSPITEYGYDLVGNLVLLIDPLGRRTRYQYDKENRVEVIVDNLSYTTQFAYDREGNLISTIDSLGFETTQRYDLRGRLVDSADRNGGISRFEYDADDNLISILDAELNKTFFDYDARNRLVRERNAYDEERRYTYDALDKLISSIDRNEREVTFAYDDLQRLQFETWVGAENVFEYSYDDVGNILSVQDAISRIEYTYDNRDRVKSVMTSSTRLKGPSSTLEYKYDGVGNVTSVKDAIDGTLSMTTSYKYDALHRQKDIQRTDTIPSPIGTSDKHVQFSYNLLGQLLDISRFADRGEDNAVTQTEYDYDLMNRLKTIRHVDQNTTFGYYGVEYDSTGRVSVINEIGRKTEYLYDMQGQLKEVNRGPEDVRGNEVYTYDKNGNRETSHLHDGYVVERNRLVSDGTYNYEYDNEGNMSVRTSAETNASRAFLWDYRNRLTSIVDRDSEGNTLQSVSYAYDAFNRRIVKAVDSVLDAQPEYSLHFIYDREDVLVDWLDNDGFNGPAVGAIKVRYLHGPGFDQVLAQDSSDGTSYWHLTDQVGSAVLLVDNSGDVQHRFEYDSFGNSVGLFGDTHASRYQFTGREFDSETSLTYSRARYLEPELGRFISEDPSGFADGLNATIYVSNSPIQFIDPTGEFGVAGFIGGAIVGAGVGYAINGAEGAAYGAVFGAVAGVIGLPMAGASLAEFFAVGAAGSGLGDAAGQIALIGLGWQCGYNRGQTIAAAGVGGIFAGISGALAGEIARRAALAPKGIPGNYRPSSPLPRGVNGEMLPSSPYPHTQLGTEVSRKVGPYTAAREFGENGQWIRDIHFTDHGRPNVPGHVIPHQHPAVPNPTGGTPQFGPAEPFTW